MKFVKQYLILSRSRQATPQEQTLLHRSPKAFAHQWLLLLQVHFLMSPPEAIGFTISGSFNPDLRNPLQFFTGWDNVKYFLKMLTNWPHIHAGPKKFLTSGFTPIGFFTSSQQIFPHWQVTMHQTGWAYENRYSLKMMLRLKKMLALSSELPLPMHLPKIFLTSWQRLLSFTIIKQQYYCGT